MYGRPHGSSGTSLRRYGPRQLRGRGSISGSRRSASSPCSAVGYTSLSRRYASSAATSSSICERAVAALAVPTCWKMLGATSVASTPSTTITTSNSISVRPALDWVRRIASSGALVAPPARFLGQGGGEGEGRPFLLPSTSLCPCPSTARPRPRIPASNSRARIRGRTAGNGSGNGHENANAPARLYPAVPPPGWRAAVGRPPGRRGGGGGRATPTHTRSSAVPSPSPSPRPILLTPPPSTL